MPCPPDELVARICVGGCGRWSSTRSASPVASQPRIERRNLERHFVARRSDGNRSSLHHLRLVIPGIDLHATAQGQSRDLIEFSVVERRTLRRQRRQAGYVAAFG